VYTQQLAVNNFTLERHLEQSSCIANNEEEKKYGFKWIKKHKTTAFVL